MTQEPMVKRGSGGFGLLVGVVALAVMVAVAGVEMEVVCQRRGGRSLGW